MGHWGMCPPQLPTILFLAQFGVNLTANYLTIVLYARSADPDDPDFFKTSEEFRKQCEAISCQQRTSSCGT